MAGGADRAGAAGGAERGGEKGGPAKTGTGPEVDFLTLHESRGLLVAVFRDLWQLGKPTVARVQGWALAGGFGLALACDMVVASDRARFGATEVNVGLWPHMVTVPLLRSIPPKKALELMLTGRVVEAFEAERLGFVARVVPHEELDSAVDELASALAAKSPAMMKLGRDTFYAVWDMGASDALAHLHAMLTLNTQTQDAAEGIAAFLEKRPPQWSGR
jgi:enoyl-CoA hydratase/carnithine racemase